MSAPPSSGYCPKTKIYHSLRPPLRLPSPSTPLSTTSYALSLLPSPLPSNPAFIFNTTNSKQNNENLCLSFPSLISSVRSLAASLAPTLPKGSVALILSPTSLHIPLINLALLSIGVIVSPINPLTTPSELAHIVRLSKPTIAFVANSKISSILPPNLPTILLDSPDFLSLLTSKHQHNENSIVVHQSDPAAILYSSGTTGRVKGVLLTHRNLIALIAGLYESRQRALAEGSGKAGPTVGLFTIPVFHIYGFFMIIRNVALGDTAVLMERFEFGVMLEAVERHRVTAMSVSPPLVVAMAKSEEARRRDLSSLEMLGCGGAALGRKATEQFNAQFPHIQIVQGYGMTETTGAAAGMATPEEALVYGSAGKLGAGLEVKIVDPESGEAVGPGVRGELWLRGPTIMKGVYFYNDI